MSGITLSASVRQNLLSLQSTADLLSTTQNRLSTGNKVNSALDNPTNFFTAQSLNNRASDINNLLDGIGNGVQVIQAANTGITSLQKLVDSAKSVATQAQQAVVGYSDKSSVSVTIAGATADNLLGTGPATSTTIAGSAAVNNQVANYSANSADGTVIAATHQAAYVNGTTTGTAAGTATGATTLDSTTLGGGAGLQDGDTLSINGKTITFNTGTDTGTADGATGNYNIGIGASVDNLLATIDKITGNTGAGSVASTIDGTTHAITLNTGLKSDITSVGGSAARVLTSLGLSAGNTVNRTGGATNTATPASLTTKLSGPQVAGGADALIGANAFSTSDTLVINGKTISFNNGGTTTGSVAGNNLSIDITTGTLQDIATAIHDASGATVSFGTGADAGKLHITTNTTQDVDFTGSSAGVVGKLGLSGLTTPNKVERTAAAGALAISGGTALSGAASGTSNALTTAFAANDTLTINGKTLTFVAGAATDDNHISVTDTVSTLLTKIDTLTGAAAGSSKIDATTGIITLATGTDKDLSISSSNSAAFAALGFSSSVSKARGTGPSPLEGLQLSIGATGLGGKASQFTFGSAGGQIKSLNDLNAQLQSNNLQATLSSDGKLTITTSNDAASATIGALTGSATDAGKAFAGLTVNGPTVDAAAAATRDAFVTQYNNILDQITTTAQDASFNGVNLLGGDTLSLTFNETGKSKLGVSGVNFNAAGLGLAKLSTGDFKDNQSVSTVVGALSNASSSLRAQASSFGSNLTIVQIRQDFSKNLINVLQTGSSNLTLADTNEEAANSQALSTRQSIAVSALSLANQSQQGVLQLLR